MGFIFEDLDVYQKALSFVEQVITLLKDIKGEPVIRDQLKRAALSVQLNIAEGGGRFSKPEKRSFYVIARGSIYECVAVAQLLRRMKIIDESLYLRLYGECECIAKMLTALIKTLV